MGGDSDFEEDLAVVTGKNIIDKKLKKQNSEEVSTEDDLSEEVSDLNSEMDENLSDEELSDGFDDIDNDRAFNENNYNSEDSDGPEGNSILLFNAFFIFLVINTYRNSVQA